MKERLNLTIDGELLEAMKAYAASKDMSVSELVESYFRTVTKPVVRPGILDLVERLEGPGRMTGTATSGEGQGMMTVDSPTSGDGLQASKEGLKHGV